MACCEFLCEFDERFLISFNAIAFRGKMSLTDLASLPRFRLIDQVWLHVIFGAKPCHFLFVVRWKKQSFFPSVETPITIVFFSNERISLTRIKQFVEIRLLRTQHELAPLMRPDNIQILTVLFSLLTVTLIQNDLVWDHALKRRKLVSSQMLFLKLVN